MASQTSSVPKHPAILLFVWVILLFAGFIFSTFLHEDGHGLGARIDGVHVSTGFNKVGDPGKFPGDPDFRASDTITVWGGLLGPMTTWFLAITFTILLYRFKGPSWGALTVGALAISNGFIRTVPMMLVLISSALGKPYLEDEIAWGIWIVVKYVHPSLATTGLDFRTLLQTYPASFLSAYILWIPPLLSLVISLACLIPAYIRVYKFWGNGLRNRVIRWLFVFIPLPVFFATIPVLNWLDRLIRINW
jgi:hypothetical protein